MYKKNAVLIGFLLLLTFTANAQYRPSPYFWEYYGSKHDSLLVIPKISTTPSLVEDGSIRYTGGFMQIRKSSAWVNVGMQDSVLSRRDSISSDFKLRLNQPELLGTIYDKSTFPNTSDFVSNGTITATASGGVIALTTSVIGTLDQSIDIPVNSMLQNWRMKMVYKVNSAIGANTHGLGIGIRSVNAAVNSSVVSYVDLSTDALFGQKLHIANTYPTNFTIVSRSPNQLPYSNGDTLELIFERQGNLFISFVRNLTTNSAYLRTSFAFTTASTSQNLANTGRFAIFAMGGNYDVQSLNIYSKEVKFAELMVIGDSKTQGYVADYANTWPNLLRTSFGSVVTSAGGGDKVAEVLGRLDEINRLRPKQILIELGSNDPDTTVFKTNYQSLVTNLTTIGAPIYHMTFYTSNNAWRNNFIKRTYPSTNIIDTWSATRPPGSLGTDGTHLTNLGDSIIYTTILNSGKLNIRGQAFSPNKYLIGSPGFIPKFDGQGNVIQSVAYENGKDIGIGLTTPTSPTGGRVLHIHDSTTGSSPTIHMTNGDVSSGAGYGTVMFVGNASGTGSGSFNIYNMDPTSGIHLFTTSTNRFSILAGGNVGISNTNPTSTFTVNGSLSVLGTTITTGTTLGSFYIYNVNNSTNITLNLPTASTCPWRIYSIKKISNNANTINIHQASGTIDGSGSDAVISAFNVTLVIYTDGANWFIQ